MSLLDDIKKDAKKSGGGLGKIFFVKDGEKRRVRFLTDFEDAIKIPWLNCYAENINCPNPEWYGKTNPYSGNEDVREDTMYLWQVYDYDSNSVKPFVYKANNCSPVLNLANMYETFGTIVDRDFVIACNGKGADRAMPVINMDKAKFRQKVSKLSSKKIKELIVAAYSKFQGEVEEEPQYADMSTVELYKLCKERDIDAEKKQPKAYYVGLLERWDEENNMQSGFDDDDEWDDEKENSDYEAMTAKELFKFCKEREIETKPRLSKEEYIKLLEEDDAGSEDDEWGEDNEDEDGWGEDPEEWEEDDEEKELPFN